VEGDMCEWEVVSPENMPEVGEWYACILPNRNGGCGKVVARFNVTDTGRSVWAAQGRDGMTDEWPMFPGDLFFLLPPFAGPNAQIRGG
jgi:hypothetical protein